jgi:tryptophan synthase beta chain
VIGDEAREQALAAEGALPARVIACVGGGSNAIGAFYAFLDDSDVDLIGVEAAGEGLGSGRHGASLLAGRTAILHGALSSVLSDEDGQILEAHSISAGLDYPGVGPEHAALRDSGRARYHAVTDRQAVDAFIELSRLEGILPALEPAHAIAWLLKNPHPTRNPAGADAVAEQPAGFDLLCLSGRGDKDLAEVLDHWSSSDGE